MSIFMQCDVGDHDTAGKKGNFAEGVLISCQNFWGVAEYAANCHISGALSMEIHI